MSDSKTLYTIGHSDHPIDRFVSLLRSHAITAIADVRSHPYCRFHTQFSREPLVAALKEAGIAYVFLGRELGARRDDPASYSDGKVQFDRVAEEPLFREGIDRIFKGSATNRIALMCAEKDPITCHRTLLVARALRDQGVRILHILADGTLEDHLESERRLFKLLKIPEGDLFTPREELLKDAYRRQSEKIAYKTNEEEEEEEYES